MEPAPFQEPFQEPLQEPLQEEKKQEKQEKQTPPVQEPPLLILTSHDGLRRYAIDVRAEPLSKALMGNVLCGHALCQAHCPVAIKRLKRACVDERTLAKCEWRRINENPRVEADVLASLQAAGGHPGIVRLLDVVEDCNSLNLVFEKAEGGDLFCALEEAHALRTQAGETFLSRPALSEDVVKRVMRQLVGALRFVHAQGFAHRDVSLENIVRMKKHGVWDVKLTDFGVVSPLRNARWVMRSGDVDRRVGKQHYAAPEAWNGEAGCPYDGCAADAWSAGACGLTLLLGQHMWSEPSCRDNVIHFLSCSGESGMVAFLSQFPYVSKGAADFFDGLLRFDPGKRRLLCEAEGHPWLQDTEPFKA